MSRVPTRSIHPSDFHRFLLPSYFSLASGIHHRAEIRSDLQKGKIQKGRQWIAAMIEGKIMNLSVEAKVAIVVATSFILLIVGAMAQG